MKRHKDSRKILRLCSIGLLACGLSQAQQLQITPAEALVVFDTVSAVEPAGFDLKKVDGQLPAGAVTRADLAVEQGWCPAPTTEDEITTCERAYADAIFVYGQAIEFGDGTFLCDPPPIDATNLQYNAARRLCMENGADGYFPAKTLASLAAAQDFLDDYDAGVHHDLVELARRDRVKRREQKQTRRKDTLMLEK